MRHAAVVTRATGMVNTALPGEPSRDVPLDDIDDVGLAGHAGRRVVLLVVGHVVRHDADADEGDLEESGDLRGGRRFHLLDVRAECLVESLDAHAEQKGWNRSEAITQAIRGLVKPT